MIPTSLRPPAPTPGLLASLQTWTWIDSAPASTPVAFFLIAHPPIRQVADTRKVVEQRMLGLAAALGLGTGSDLIPDIGPRLRAFGQGHALLRVDGCPYRLRMRADPRWLRLLDSGASALVAIALDPLRRGAPPADVDQYLDTAVPTGRLLFGATRAAHARP